MSLKVSQNDSWQQCPTIVTLATLATLAVALDYGKNWVNKTFKTSEQVYEVLMFGSR